MTLDLQKIVDVLRTADIEGCIEIHGCPKDEYDSEAQELYKAIFSLDPKHKTVETVAAALALIWARSFHLNEKDLSLRMSPIHDTARQILTE